MGFSVLTLLVWRQEGHPACKKTEWWGAGVVICLKLGADLHIAQLMLPLALTVSCFSKIQIGFAYLVPAQPRSPGKRAVKRVCVCYGHDLWASKNEVQKSVRKREWKQTDRRTQPIAVPCLQTYAIDRQLCLLSYVVRLPTDSPGLFTDTSERIRFFFCFSVFCFPLSSRCFRAVD